MAAGVAAAAVEVAATTSAGAAVVGATAGVHGGDHHRGAEDMGGVDPDEAAPAAAPAAAMAAGAAAAAAGENGAAASARAAALGVLQDCTSLPRVPAGGDDAVASAEAAAAAMRALRYGLPSALSPAGDDATAAAEEAAAATAIQDTADAAAAAAKATAAATAVQDAAAATAAAEATAAATVMQEAAAPTQTAATATARDDSAPVAPPACSDAVTRSDAVARSRAVTGDVAETAAAATDDSPPPAPPSVAHAVTAAEAAAAPTGMNYSLTAAPPRRGTATAAIPEAPAAAEATGAASAGGSAPQEMGAPTGEDVAVERASPAGGRVKPVAASFTAVALPVASAAGPAARGIMPPPAAAGSAAAAAAAAPPAAALEDGSMADLVAAPVADDSMTHLVADGRPGAAAAASVGDAPVLSAGEEIVSLVARLILCPGPAVLSKTLAIPALAVAYYISQMGFLAGLPPDDASTIIHKTMVNMFCESPVAGWKLLCRMFGVPDRGLYLSGRRAHHTHLVGQPSTVPNYMNENLNPKKEPQWVSRRLCLRTSISLLPDAENNSGPGALSSTELRKLRELLSTSLGRSLAINARCVVLPVTAGNVENVEATSLRFDWAHPWVPLSPSWRLVQALGPAFLRPPHSDLSTVHLFPVDDPGLGPSLPSLPSATTTTPTRLTVTPDAQTPTTPTAPTARTPSSGRAGRGKRAASAPPRPPRQGRAGVRVTEPAEKQPVFLPGLPTTTHLSVAGEVLPSSAWPEGAWAMQVSLSSSLDESAVGKVPLGVTAEFETLKANEIGEYAYSAHVFQMSTVETPLSKQLGPCITAASGIDPRCRSVDFLEAVRDISDDELAKPKRRAAGVADGLQPSSQEQDNDAMDTRDEDDVPVASGPVRMTVRCAPPPPPVPFSFRFSFACRLRLLIDVVCMRRTPGRLWLVIPAEKERVPTSNVA